MKYKLKIKVGFFILQSLFVAGMVSCQNDYYNSDSMNVDVPEDGMAFKAIIVDEPVSTRALTQDPDLVNNTKYNIDFYIQEVDPLTEKGESKEDFATYVIPSGYQGELMIKEGGEKLNWYDGVSNHTFWSWTVPWMNIPAETEEPEQGESGSGDMGNSDGTRADDLEEPGATPGDGGELDSEVYVPSAEPITFTLRETSIEDYGQKGSWNNGLVMEKFLGTKSGPFNYKENGRDVPLQYRHLMSKISVISFQFIDAGGSVHEDFRADIEFINMPSTFTFYPHPTEQNVTDNPGNKYIKADGAPIVVTDMSTASPDKAFKFAMMNPADSAEYDDFYICPEIDFSKVEFKVSNITPPTSGSNYNGRGEYWGDFKNLRFERIPGTDYDNPNIEGEEYLNDDTVLHAGEVMFFELVVQEFGGGGTSIYIRNWSSGPINESTHYPHPGIYTEADLRSLCGSSEDLWGQAWENQGNGSTADDPEIMNPDYPDDQNPYKDKNWPIFDLYGDATLGSYYFDVARGYLINGNGYTVDLTVPAAGFDTYNYIRLGNVRDIYINYGDYSIYVDQNGYVYFLDKDTGKYIKSELQINGTYRYYYIYFTGENAPRMTYGTAINGYTPPNYPDLTDSGDQP